MYYAFIQDNKINGCGQCRRLTDGIINYKITKDIFDNISHYSWDGKSVVLNPNWEEEEYKKQRKQEILIALDELDLKSIRALRANDTEYIQEYEAQAQVLREELRGL